MASASQKVTAAPSRSEALSLLKDTQRAVKVMKASWLHVALNLKRIHHHELWRLTDPPCQSYEEYVLDVLKLNKYVAARMLRAVVYTEERRPEVLREFEARGAEVDVPSCDVVDRLRRVQNRFEDREDDFRALESRVFDDGVGRVTLKREIDEKLGSAPPEGEPGEARGEATVAAAHDSIDRLIDDLMQVERRLLGLKVSKEARRLMFQLVETLQKERA